MADRTWTEADAIEEVRRSRAAQGLSAHVVDLGALRKVAVLLTAGRDTSACSSAVPSRDNASARHGRGAVKTSAR